VRRIPHVDHADQSAVLLSDGDTMARLTLNDEGAYGARELRGAGLRAVDAHKLVEPAHDQGEHLGPLAPRHVADPQSIVRHIFLAATKYSGTL